MHKVIPVSFVQPKTSIKESYLLEKIIKEDGLNTLIVNLYPGHEGYSLMLNDNIGKEVETVKLPYEVINWIFFHFSTT